MRHWVLSPRIRKQFRATRRRRVVVALLSVALAAAASPVGATGLDSCAYHVVDTWDRSATGDGPFWAVGIAADAAGNVFVTDWRRMRKFDNDGNLLATWGSEGTENGQFGEARSVATDASGNVFVSDIVNKNIQKFDNAGNFLARWGSSGTEAGQFYAPLELAVDPAGNVFVSDGGRIQKFDNDGNFLTMWGNTEPGYGTFGSASYLATDRNGNVFAANANGSTRQIQKFDNAGNFIRAWDVGDMGSFGPIAVDSAGNVFALSLPNAIIQKFDNDGHLLTSLGAHSSVWGMTVDAHDNLFLTTLTTATQDTNHVEKLACDSHIYWLVGDDSGVGVIQNDTVIQRIADHHGDFGNQVVREIAVDEAKGTAYAFMQRPKAEGKTPAVHIDLATLTTLGTVTDPNGLTALGNQTFGGTLSPDGTRAYYTDQTQLVVVDTASDEVLAVVPIDPTDSAQGVRISPDGMTAYVRGFQRLGGLGGQTIYVIDLTTNAIVSTIPLPSNWMTWDSRGAISSSGFILSPDGTTLYAIDGDQRMGPITDSTVFAIDTATHAVMPVTSLADSMPVPTGLLLVGSHLYVVSRSFACPAQCSGGVAVVDTVTHAVIAGVGLADNTGAIGVSLDGEQIYIGSLNGDFLWIIDAATNVLRGRVSNFDHLVTSAQTAVDPYLAAARVVPPSVCPPTPALGCRAASPKASIKLGRGSSAARNKLDWKWMSSAPVAPADFGSLLTTDYEVCMYDQTGLVLSARAPAGGDCVGRPCWKENRSGGKYTDKSLLPDGVLQLSLKAGGPGKAKIDVKGKGPNLHVPNLPLSPRVTMQLLRADTGACWEATYTDPTVNGATSLKAKADQ